MSCPPTSTSGCGARLTAAPRPSRPWPELLRARKIRGLQRLDQLKRGLGYVAITTATMMQAALFWADVRQRGLPTAANDALDADVILAAQAALLLGAGHSVTIATTNVGHLARLAPAELCETITA